jgi:outer membrane receptor protein involved in Fe transport
MKNFLFLIIFLIIALSQINAQDWRNFKEGKISGKIVDKEKKEGFIGVSVVVKHLRDSSFIKGTVTNEKGEYVIEGLKAGRYELSTDFIGYKKEIITNIPVTPKNTEAKVQNIELVEDSKVLNEVVVEEKKEFIQATADGIVVNPANNPTQQSGTAADVLRDVPSVRVDESGNVTLRGGRPNILINGRQSNFGGGGGRGGWGGGGGGLDQIAADDVESIEINTNPSSKFDADGVSGLINVRLKRDRQPGTHGNVNLAVGNRERVFGGFRLNHRTTKWNTSFGYNARFDNRLSENITERNTFSLNQQMNQNHDFKNHSENHNFRAGVEFNPNSKNTLNFDAIIGVRGTWNDGALITRNFQNSNFLNGNKQDNNSANAGLSYDFTLAYKGDLKNKGQEISASVSTSLGFGDDRQSLSKRIFLGDGTSISDLSRFSQNTLNNTRNNITTIQFDYTHPFGEGKGVLETGYKAIIRNLKTNFELDSLNKNLSIWQRDLIRSNDFAYNESVHAAYISYKNKWKKWDYTAGLRFEQVWLDGTTVSANQNIAYTKQYFNIFPTARIAYNFTPGEFLKLSYSKRIDRPNFNDLNPFIDVSNPLNLRQGNPNLNPELIHVLELGYNKFWDKVSITPNIFYRRRTNLVQRIITLDPSGIVAMSTPFNIGSSDAYGIDFVGSYEPIKWFSVNGGFSGFQTTINPSENQSATINSTVTTWNTRLNLNFTLWKQLRLQIGGMYNAPTAIAQGENIGFYSFNAGLQMPLSKDKKWSIGLMARDIFYTMKFGSITYGENFSQSAIVLRDTRMIMLRVNYRF